MGIEVIYPIAWLISTVALIWLIARLRNSDARPYALPTLLLSTAIALLLAWNDRSVDIYNKAPDVSPLLQYFLTWFALAVLVLGLQAHIIRWLITRRRPANAP